MLDYPAVKTLVREVANQAPDAIIHHLVKAGERWANRRPQDDDVSFVVVKVRT